MRIDVHLVGLGLFSSRNRAQRAVEAGEVTVDGKIVTKPGFELKGDEEILVAANGYASVGKFKLLTAVERFSIDLSGVVAVDAGASNGGFTEVLLAGGAKKVYAVDVGEGQLMQNLSLDARVAVMDKTNVRTLSAESFCEPIDFLTCDVSFISLKLILQNIADILRPGGRAVLLIKPQFEVGQAFLSKRGIVTEEKKRRQVVDEIVSFAENLGLKPLGTAATKTDDAQKNTEYLLYVQKGVL